MTAGLLPIGSRRAPLRADSQNSAVGFVLHITEMAYLFKNKTNTVNIPTTQTHPHAKIPQRKREDHSILKTVLKEGIPSCIIQGQHLWDKFILPVTEAALI